MMASQHVLELVLPYLTDLKTLCTCSNLSTELKAHTQYSITQTLPALVAASPLDISAHSRPKGCPLQWLCNFAGKEAVNGSDAAVALLQQVIPFDSADAADFLAKTGLQLNRELLMHVTKTHRGSHYTSPIGLLAMCMERKGCAEHVPHFYMEAATWGWHWVDGEVRRNSAHPKSIDYFVARVKPAELPDILLLLVCQAPNEAAAAEAALALLERDKKELHVLHSKCQKGSGGNGGQAGADVALRIRRGSSVPHWFVDWCQRSSKAAKDQDERCLQQQQQAAELVMELLSVCVTFDLADVCKAVAALPAGQDIGPVKVTELLYTAFMQLKRELYYKGPSLSVLQTLVGLPGAAGVSTDCFANILRVCVMRKDASKFEPVLKLPCAQQLSSQQLCDMIITAGRAEFLELVPQLCRLADGRELDRDAVMGLIEQCLTPPFACGDGDDLTATLELLEGLQPGRHITGNDLLQLMLKCANRCGYRDGWAGLARMADWQPAAGAATDLPLFVSVLEAATAAGGWDVGTTLQTLVKKLPIAQQLQQADWLTVMQAGLKQHINSYINVCLVLKQQPELKHMAVEDLTKLLTTAVQSGSDEAVAALCALPAAQQVEPSVLSELLTTSAQRRNRGMRALLELPAVERLELSVTAEVLKAAVQHEGIQAVQAIVDLPVAQQLGPDVLADLLLATAAQEYGSFKATIVGVLLALPAAQQLQPAMLSGLLLELLVMVGKTPTYIRGLKSESLKAFQHLCAHPLAHKLDVDSVQRLFDAATDMGCEGRELLECISQLPQAAGMQGKLSLSSLLPLLQKACSNGNGRGGQEELLRLLREPAAQELQGSTLVDFLGTAARHNVGDAVAALQQLPGCCRLNTKAVWDLTRTALYSRQQPWLDVYSQHPAAAEVSKEQVVDLMKPAFEQGIGTADQYRALLRLPCVQQFNAAVCESLMYAGIAGGNADLLPALLELPGMKALDPKAAWRLIQAAMDRDLQLCKYDCDRADMTRALLEGLPAVGQLTAGQCADMLFEAMRVRSNAIQEALAESSVLQVAGRTSPELAAMCQAVLRLKNREYPFVYS